MTGQPSLTLRTGFMQVNQVRSDWAPDPKRPHPMLAKPHRVPYGVTLVGRLYEEGTLGRVGRALEAKVAVAGERSPGVLIQMSGRDCSERWKVDISELQVPLQSLRSRR